MAFSIKQHAGPLVSSVLQHLHTSTTAHPTIGLWVIVLLGGLLRFYRLGEQSFWIDEGLQYFIASAESLTGVFERVSRSVHPALSYLISHVFLQLGSSDVFLRLPSVLFGIATLPLVYLLAQQITSQRTAVFTVLICVVSPFHIWYSQDGRMYAQLLFFSLLSTVVLLQAVAREKLYWWGAYALVVVAGMYTHVFMALAVMTQFFWLLLWHRRHLLLYSLSGVVTILLCLPMLTPWVAFFFYRVDPTSVISEAVIGGRVGFLWMALPYAFFVYSAGFSLGPSVADLHDERSLGFLLQFLPIICTVAVVFGALLFLGLRVTSRYYGIQSLSLCLLGLVGPLAALTLLSMMTRFTFNTRYTIVAFPYFCILIGAAIAWGYRKSILFGTVAGIAVLCVSAMSLSNYFFNPTYAKEDVRSAIAFWRTASTHEPLLCPPTGGIGYLVNHYLTGAERDRYVPIGGRSVGSIVDKIHTFFSTHNASSTYVLLARDWYRVRENAIRQAFVVTQERSFPGRVKILRISRR